VLRFFRNYSVGNTTINYTSSGSALTDGDYSASPALSGSVTITNGSDHTDFTISANKPTQQSTNTLNVSIASGNYQINSGASGTAITIYPDYPTIFVGLTTVTGTNGRINPAFLICRDSYYSMSSAKTVNYKMSGTASNGVDYQTLSGSASIPAGASSVLLPVTPKTTPTNEKSVTLTLTNGIYNIGTSNITAYILPDFQIINLQAVDDYAVESGTNAGMFSLTRDGLTNQSLAVHGEFLRLNR